VEEPADLFHRKLVQAKTQTKTRLLKMKEPVDHLFPRELIQAKT
jgi:hypothetical protein